MQSIFKNTEKMLKNILLSQDIVGPDAANKRSDLYRILCHSVWILISGRVGHVMLTCVCVMDPLRPIMYGWEGHGHVMLTCICVMDPLRPIMYGWGAWSCDADLCLCDGSIKAHYIWGGGHGHMMLICVCVMDPLRPIIYGVGGMVT